MKTNSINISRNFHTNEMHLFTAPAQKRMSELKQFVKLHNVFILF